MLAMRERRQSPKKHFKELLDLIHTGKLFALQEWIKSGKPLKTPESLPRAPRLLCAAVRTGFHSIVEELLRATKWPPREMADALDWARSRRRYDIADLLLNHGAEPEQQDFQTLCETLDLTMMERHLRAGTDPNKDNVFARVLAAIKARPLLKFYRQFRVEFPALDDQASLALCEAVRANQVRWTALLSWAGADPLRPVPYDLDGTFPVDPENSTTAAEVAIWRNNPEILRLLRLNPNASQAVALLSDAGHYGNQDLFRSLLKPLSPAQLNTSARGSCSPLERLVNRYGRRGSWDNSPNADSDKKALECVELLLDAGARWDPLPDDLRRIRRNILDHDPRYIVQLLRLLLYTPNVANVGVLLELCRSQTLLGKIATVDLPFVQEIKQLRKAHPPVTTSSPNATSYSPRAPAAAPAEAP
jgi:hypothetical protein